MIWKRIFRPKYVLSCIIITDNIHIRMKMGTLDNGSPKHFRDCRSRVTCTRPRTTSSFQITEGWEMRLGMPAVGQSSGAGPRCWAAESLLSNSFSTALQLYQYCMQYSYGSMKCTVTLAPPQPAATASTRAVRRGNRAWPRSLADSRCTRFVPRGMCWRGPWWPV